MPLKRGLVCPPGVFALDALNGSTWQAPGGKKS